MEEHHSMPLGGHRGELSTVTELSKRFYWPELRHDVETHIKRCEKCQANRPNNQKKAGLLRPLPIPQRPFESISMDFMTQLPSSGGVESYDAIFVVVDRFSKLAMFVPTKTTSSAEYTAKLFLDRWVVTNGFPRDIVSDRDVKFTSTFWQHLMSRLKTKLKMNTAFHPETDGQTERVNQVLNMYLRNYVAADQRDWTEWLALAEFCYNSHKHTATKQSPFYVARGFEPLTPVELALELRDEEESSPPQDGDEPSIPRGGENDLGIMGMFDINAQEYISQRELTLRNVRINLELA